MDRRQLILRAASSALSARALPVLSPLAFAPRAAKAQAGGALRVGLLVNMTGVGAMYGPIAQNCADIAVAEINGRGGVAGRTVQMVVGDAGAEPDAVVDTALRMMRESGVEAFVAMHNSAVRVALVKAFAGRIPYIYTTIYEGGECSRGTYLLGTTPSQQLRPVVPWFTREFGVKRWYLLGNDYNWPRGTNAKARQYIAGQGASVVGEEYVPFDFENFEAVVARIAKSGADTVLVTLVGASSVRFNQVFGKSPFSDTVIRLSTYMDEITLAALEPGTTKNLWSSAGYFAGLKTTAAKAFSAEYARRFGSASILNDSAQACYEGFRLLEVMGNKARSVDVSSFEKIAQWQITDGPRGQTVMHARHTIRDIYLAKAEGTGLRVVKTFEAVRSDDACKLELRLTQPPPT